MEPELVRQWLRVGRDVVIYALATAAISVQLVRTFQDGAAPNVTWLGFAAFLFGLVPAIRADEWLFRGGERGNRDS